ncbi:MAG: hypothetical protein QNJ47_02005 [Nostocaceae cyanobacterium]|nr:hypothetical protein [Nostocaceae cyanobacterium]
MSTQLDTNFTRGIFEPFQQGKDFVNGSISSVTNFVQQIGDSWKETATQATDKVIDGVNTTLEQTLEAAGGIQSTTSTMIETAISDSMNDWLTQHPGLLRLLQICGWAVNHPIISLIIIVFVISILWSIIKNISRLIEAASWSILQTPLKLILAIFKLGFTSSIKVFNVAIKKLKTPKKNQLLLALPPANYQMVSISKQKRLADISARLEALQQEQQKLIQEAATILESEDSHTEVSSDIKIT